MHACMLAMRTAQHPDSWNTLLKPQQIRFTSQTSTQEQSKSMCSDVDAGSSLTAGQHAGYEFRTKERPVLDIQDQQHEMRFSNHLNSVKRNPV